MQILGNQADADDASQEAALRIYQHLPDFEGRSSLRTWMSTIVTRQCINLMRQNSKTLLQDHIAQMISLHEEIFLNASPQMQPDERKAVQSVLEDLQPKSRDVLQLRFYSELSLEEISAVLGITLSAAKMRFYRALDHFVHFYGPTAWS